MWVTVFLGVAWLLWRLLNNTGWILDDELCHYGFSRSVWENPELLFNHWTRPGRNLLHCIAAPFGLTATRIYTLFLALIAIAATYQLGKILKVRMLWLVPMLAIFQSWFPELSYPVLTQTPFMLVWVLGVWLGVTKRWHLAGFCFGYLSLIRHEGILLTGIWWLWVSCNEEGFVRGLIDTLRGNKVQADELLKKLGRDCLYGVSTVSAIAIYNLAAFIYNGSFPLSVYFESKPTTMYGSGTLFHYVPLLINGLGVVVALLSFCGVFGLRGMCGKWSLLLATYPVYFLLHSFIYWKGAFASGGYYHFLMPMVPFFALLAAEGVGVLSDKVKPFWRKSILFTVVGLVMFQGINMMHHQVCYQNWAAINAGNQKAEFKWIAKPMSKGELSNKVVEASHWAKAEFGDGTLVLAKHRAHNFIQGTLSTREQLTLENLPLYKMPQGTVYIWDSSYCEYENRIRYESFTSSQDWEIVKIWDLDYPVAGSELPQEKYAVIVFEKVSARDIADKEYAELGEADKVNQIYE